MKILHAWVFDSLHHWMPFSAMLLLAYAVVARASDGVVMSLAGLVASLMAATGVVHGWKATTISKWKHEKTVSSQVPPGE